MVIMSKNLTPKDIRQFKTKIKEFESLVKRETEEMDTCKSWIRFQQLRENIESYNKEIEYLKFLISENNCFTSSGLPTSSQGSCIG